LIDRDDMRRLPPHVINQLTDQLPKLIISSGSTQNSLNHAIAIKFSDVCLEKH